MTANVDGVLLKLYQAQVHLDAFNAEIESAEQGQAYALVCEPDVEPCSYLVKVVQQERLDKSSLYLGDFVHNCRSTLDHLVWQLALAGGIGKPDTRSQFPIFLEDDAFTRAAVIGSEKRKPYLHDIPPDAVEMIRRVQPFDPSFKGDRNLHPLWLLHQLDIVDKHRLIHTIALVPEELRLMVNGATGGWIELFEPRVAEHNTVLARIVSDTKPEMQQNSQLSLIVRIEETSLTPELELGVVDAILYAVYNAFAALVPFTT